MRTTARLLRGLGAVLLGAALLVGAPAATATAATETASQAEAAAGSLPAPTLDKATIKGDNVVLVWERVADSRVTGYVISANGRLLRSGWRTGASTDYTVLYLASLGLTGREVFTVTAGADFGPDGIPRTTSAQSNGRVAVAPASLPAPVLTRATAVRTSWGGATVTLTWRPSQSDEADINYEIWAFGNTFVHSVKNTTTVTFNPDACGGACPLSGTEPYSIRATDRTLAQSPFSNSLVPSAS